MTSRIFAALLLSLTVTACESSTTNENNANSTPKPSATAQVSPTPVAATPGPSLAVQTPLKAGDKVRVTINGRSSNATVVSVDEKSGKVTVKLDGQTEEKTVPIGDVTKKNSP